MCRKKLILEAMETIENCTYIRKKSANFGIEFLKIMFGFSGKNGDGLSCLI